MTGKEEAPSMSGNSARGNDRNLNTYEKETTMNDASSLATTPTFEADCPVVGCDKIPADHHSADQSDNLHTCVGPDWTLPLDAYPIMDETSWPVWKLWLDLPYVEVTTEMGRNLADGILVGVHETDRLNALVDVPALLALRDAASAAQ